MRFKFLVFLALVSYGVYLAIEYYRPPYQVEINLADIPVFREVELKYSHVYKHGKLLPVVGAAAFDVDADQIPELFIGGGHLQRDELFRFKDNSFVNITQNAGLIKAFGDISYGAASIDVDNNGYADLFVARDSGIYLYLNDKGYLRPQKLNISMNQDNAVTVSISLADINRDGFVDLFLSNYLRPAYIQKYNSFNQPRSGARCSLLLNSGDNLTFIDITEQAGIGIISNGFNAVFADFNIDQMIDLAVAHAGGHIEIFQNKGGAMFSAVPNPTTARFTYPMALVATDYDNNGTLDLFSATTGSSVPGFLARGDLGRNQLFHNKWILLNNKTEWIFSDQAHEALLADYEMGRGAAFADFNMDGLQDLVVTTNFIDYLPHHLLKSNAKLLLQTENGEFAAVQDQAQIRNKHFGSTALTADFNNDGYSDLVFLNTGSPAKAYVNNGGIRHFSRVILDNSPSAIGSRVTLETGAKKRLTQYLIAGGNLASDQDHNLLFGLNQETSIRKIEILYPNGESYTLNNPKIDTTLYANVLKEKATASSHPETTVIPSIDTNNTDSPEPNSDTDEWTEPVVLQAPDMQEDAPESNPPIKLQNLPVPE